MKKADGTEDTVSGGIIDDEETVLTDGDISTDGGTGGGTIIGKDKDIDCLGGTIDGDGTEDISTDGGTGGGTIIGN